MQVGFSNTYSVALADKKTDSPVDLSTVSFAWSIASDFDIEKKENNNEIELYVGDEDLAGEKFKLQVIVEDIVIAEIVISISSIV